MPKPTPPAVPATPAHTPRHRKAPDPVICLVNGARARWTPGTTEDAPGVLTAPRSVEERFWHAIRSRAWAPVAGVLLCADETTAPGALAALHFCAPGAVEIVSLPAEVEEWLRLQRAQAGPDQNAS